MTLYPLLEITGDDIAELNDGDLRDLIGMLCEADYCLKGLPTKNIVWGGHQDAPDGGLDVIVRDNVKPPEESFVPRSKAGFQVKKPNMPKSAMLKEMKPDGILRADILSLIKDNPILKEKYGDIPYLQKEYLDNMEDLCREVYEMQGNIFNLIKTMYKQILKLEKDFGVRY